MTDKLYTDRYKALKAASDSGKPVLFKSDFGVKVIQPDGVSYFMKGNSGPKLVKKNKGGAVMKACLLYTSPSPRDLSTPRMPSSA